MQIYNQINFEHFYVPEIEDWGAYGICPVSHSDNLFFCNSVVN